jgi:hypothetical protein
MEFQNKKYSFSLCLLVFCVGALSKFDVTLLARVPMGELLAFGAIPFLWKRDCLARSQPQLSKVLWIFAIWAFGIFLSDVFNDFIFQRFIRGFMKPIFCIGWLLFFVAVIRRNSSTLFFYPVGMIVAALQNYFLPRAFTVDRVTGGGYDSIAYGLVPIVAAVSVVASLWLYGKNRLLGAFAFFANAGLMLAVGAPRSSAALSILVGLAIVYLWWRHRREGGARPLHLSRIVMLSGAGFLAGLCIFYTYTFTAANGWLGEYQYQKFVDQSNTIFGASPLGLILDGRTYTFAAILAVIDKPLLGYGSWTGWMMSDYYFEAVQLVGTNASELDRMVAMGGAGKAGHSLFFASWMENGILAGLAILSIFLIMLKQGLQIVRFDSPLAPWLVSLLVSFSWGFFFSPFGTGTRMIIGLFFALYLTGSVAVKHRVPVRLNR